MLPLKDLLLNHTGCLMKSLGQGLDTNTGLPGVAFLKEHQSNYRIASIA
jgi:hypothetical protein